MLIQSVLRISTGLVSSVTLYMRTEYHMSGPNPSSVTSREKGGVQEMLNDVAFSETLKSPTDDSSPKFK